MFTKAKIHITLNHGFFAEVPLHMKFVEDASVGTVGINMTEIRYSPEFVKNLTKDERIAVLAHEALHYFFMHHLRGKGKDQDLWNKACDHAINPELKKAGFNLPENHLDDPRFHGMNVELIYAILLKEKQIKESSSSDGSSSGESDNSKPQNWGKVLEPSDDVDLAKAEAEVKQMITSAMNTAKVAGKLPAGIERVLQDVLEPKQNWREVTLKFLAEKAKNDYTWVRPNPRYIQQGVYLPALESLELGKVVFAIDASGSMDIELLTQIFAEVREASTLFRFPLIVIYCDTKVQKVEEVDEDTVMKPVGGGGTAFTPVFDYINENLPETKAVIYFTDGYCSDKVSEPEYETLWMVYDNPTFKYNFGTIIHLET
jgi:predicted metal-dependent peptidase